jgi:biotin carboxylase
MPTTTILCISSYFKGEDFLDECRRLGCRVILVTVEKLRDAAWPRESIDEIYFMPDLFRREDVIHGISYLARTERIDRIVPLDEFDLEMASALREHLRIPGMGETTVRYFRDKLAMRMRALEVGIPVPDFSPIVNHHALREYMERVPPPWVLKPRFSASAIGIHVLREQAELWPLLEELGDRQSFHLLERFVPGDVFHVDGIAWDRRVVFEEAHGYLSPPFEVYHGGGLFCTRTIERESPEAAEMMEMNRRVVESLGMVRGAMHTEFIRGEDGRLYFLETAARVGGANIAQLVEASTGVSLWREWARVEVASARGESYSAPSRRDEYAGLLLSLARQEWPDTSSYDDLEIRWRMKKLHHVGLIVASPSHQRVERLLSDYLERFRTDFYASMPPLDEAIE